MIAGIFSKGSGLGDMLFRYITVRTVAQNKGYKWGMLNPENFKGRPWMQVDLGNHPSFYKFTDEWNEREIRDSRGIDVRSFDPEIIFVKDNTIMDGSFEDSNYWGHNLPIMHTWLKVDSLKIPEDLCILGFRGGEYATVPELFLTKDYWETAIAHMKAINPEMKFQVHTDDPLLAKTFFPEYEVVENTQLAHSQHSNMGFNWRSTYYARYAIIPNSAFFVLPRLMAHQRDEWALTIAPRGWSRRNLKDGTWGRPACFYEEFLYV